METLLVAGIETIVGANLAARMADQYQVIGLSFGRAVQIAGCETSVCPSEELDSVRHSLASVRPTRLVYCGPAAQSSWQPAHTRRSIDRVARNARHWASGACEFGCALTYISSDAVLTGPWMFHTEQSDSFCTSAEATSLRNAEQEVARLCPDALIVRTNAFGWSPGAEGEGWIEELLQSLERQSADPADGIRHAAPILATELARTLQLAHRERLTGLYHIAGAERVSPARFLARLAEQFHLPVPQPRMTASLAERATGFGCGETSLHTRRIRRALGTAMPLLADGLAGLYEQHLDGYRARLHESRTPIRDRVA